MPKRIIVGIVTSDTMAKTRVVEVARSVRHPKYGKRIRRRTKCYVHDEGGQSARGDKVEIEECPPKSRTKRWTLLRVVQKGAVAESLETESGLELS